MTLCHSLTLLALTTLAAADPPDAGALRRRPDASRNKQEYDAAHKGYDAAIRLDPQDALAFRGRGNAWRGKARYDRALDDYAEASRLDPQDAATQFYLAVTRVMGRRPGAATAFRAVIDLQGGGGKLAPYAVVLGHLAAARAGDDDAAKRFLTDAAGKLDAAWPEPAVRFLRGDLDEPGLLKLAAADDPRTEARCYLGMHHALKGRAAESAAHYRWVRASGNKDYVEYGIAVAELDRLDAATKP